MWVVLAVLSSGLAAPSLGDAAARHYALQRDLTRLVRSNSWAAVDEAYRELVLLPFAASTADHLGGARAALARGDALLAWYRIMRVRPGPADGSPAGRERLAEVDALRTDLECRYGLANLFVPRDEEDAVLTRRELPFKKDERQAIEAAASAVEEHGAYRRLLPEGAYALGDVAFLVPPGLDRVKTVIAGVRATGDPVPAGREIPAVPPPR